jgi:two-component system, response regulator PdtaR
MSELNSIQVLIVEDEVLIAEDIKEICEEAGYVISKLCYSASQAMVAINEQEYDLAIFDINLEDQLSGLDLAHYIKRQKKLLPYIFLTSYSDTSTLSAAKDVQPMGYVVKPFKKEQLISSIEIAISNYQSFKFPSLLPVDIAAQKYHITFTDREKEIIPMLCSGQTNQQISKKIFLSINTVKFHIKSIYEKLNVSNRAQLIMALQ